jgi:alkylhydroperoxidase family enzyme
LQFQASHGARRTADGGENPMRRTVWAILTILVTAAGLFAVVTIRTGAMSKEPRFPLLAMDRLIGRQWRSQVEWFAHAPLAIKAGLSPDIVADLKAGRRPSAMPPEETAVYDFVTEVTMNHAVSDETFGRAKKLLGEQQVVDLTTVAGTYFSIAMLLAMSEESVPPGKELPFKPDEP